MRNETALRIVLIQEQAMEDEVYQALLAEYCQRSGALSRVMAALTEQERGAVEDWMGLVAEMHRRMLELACQ